MRDVLQSEIAECGLACLATIASHHGLQLDLAQLRGRFSIGGKGTTLSQLMNFAAELGFVCRPLRLEVDYLNRLRLPCILHWDFSHFVVLKSVDKGRRASLVVSDPAHGERRVDYEELNRRFTGVALELTPNPGFSAGDYRPSRALKALLGPVEGLKTATAQAITLAACLEILAIGMPLFNQLVLDHAVADRNESFLGALAIGFALVLVTQNMIALARGWFLMRWNMSLALQWSTRLFTHLIHIPTSYFQKRHVGDIATNFASIGAIQRLLSTCLLEASLDCMMALAAFALMWFYSPKLMLVVIAAMAAYILLHIRLYAPMRDARLRSLSAQGAETSFFMESLRSVTALQLFGKTHERVAGWQSIGIDVQSQEVRTEKLTVGFKVCQNAVLGGQGLLLFYMGGVEIIRGNLSVGMLVAFTTYAVTFATRVTNLVNLAAEVKMLGIHTDRLSDILNEPALLPANAAKGAARLESIELRHVGFRYATGQPWILEDVNLSIVPGRSIGIAGESGCGKSTLGKILLGLEHPTQGDILVNGVPMRDYGIANYRAMISAVLQDDILLRGTIADDICFHDLQRSMPRIREAAGVASLDSDLQRMPMQLDTLAGEAGALLSSGQRQRILIARAIYANPCLMVLDEASSNLDPQTERHINRNLADLNITKIVISHRAETIDSCDDVYLLKNGKLQALEAFNEMQHVP